MRMTKRGIKCFCVLAAGCLLISGCGGISKALAGQKYSAPANQAAQAAAETTADRTESEGGNDMGDQEIMNLTEQEKKLLCEIYPMEDRIMEGRLFSYQKRTVGAFRAGMNWLSAKYPEYTFEALSLAPATKFYPWMTVRIRSGNSGVRELRVTPGEEGYSFGDTFYNELLREKYDAKVEELLREAGFTTRSFTEFTAAQEKTGPETSVEELLEMKSLLPRMTHLYIDGVSGKEEQGSTAEAVRTALKDAGVYGAYILYFVPGGLILETEDLEKQRLQYESSVFNCYDVK